MSRTVLAATLLLFAPTLLSAQQDPKAAYDDLAKAFNKAIAQWQEEAQQAQQAGKKIPAPPTKEFIGQAQELATSFAGKDEAVRFLAFIVKSASNERNAVKKAVETLATDHAKSKAIGEALPFLPNALRFGAQTQVMALLDQFATGNADTDCQAQARITRGALRLRSEDEAVRKQAEQDLREVAKLTKNEELLTQAKDALFEIEHLQVGCAAPEIAGVDVEGVPFKLGDYRGKVVLLDFWGFW